MNAAARRRHRLRLQRARQQAIAVGMTLSITDRSGAHERSEQPSGEQAGRSRRNADEDWQQPAAWVAVMPPSVSIGSDVQDQSEGRPPVKNTTTSTQNR